jgi:tripartite-type tricarboxylate transporter receptor subunit TctC
MNSRRAMFAFGLLCLSIGIAQAQTYPSRTITLVVPAAPGGVSDVLARAISQRLTDAWGQQVIVENKGGANHMLGAASVAKAAPDGYTLMLSAEATFVVNPSLYAKAKLPYDADKDFAPITGLMRNNQALLAFPGLPVNSVAELIALAKTTPGELTYGTSGPGSAGHVNMALFETMAGVKLTPVHYRGMNPALVDVMAGHTKLLSVSVSSGVQPFRAGQVKMLGIGSRERLPQLPEVSTVAESVPGYEAVTWFGLFATAGTPTEIVMKINAEVRRIFADEAFREKFLVPNLFEPMLGTPEEFAAFIRADAAKWSKVIRDANLKVD